MLPRNPLLFCEQLRLIRRAALRITLIRVTINIKQSVCVESFRHQYIDKIQHEGEYVDISILG